MVRRNRQIWIGFIAFLLSASTAFADSQSLIDRIDYEQDGSDRFVVIRLTERLMYQSHFPAVSATTFEITMRPVDNPDNGVPDAAFLRPRSVVLAPLAQDFPLVSVSYERGATDNVTLVLRFSDGTPIRVSQSRDLRSIEIALANSVQSTPKHRREAVATTRAEENLAARADRLKQLMILAQRALESQHYEEARTAFADIIYLGPHPYMNEAEKLHRLAKQGGVLKASSNSEDLFTVDEVGGLVEAADGALNKGDNRRAIVLFTKIGQLPEHKYSAHSLEMLGVARQRNDQTAHAKAIYREYLTRYPTNDGAVRVQQRLAELLATGHSPGPRTMEKVKVDQLQSPNDNNLHGEHFGMLSQSYYHGKIAFEELDEDRSDQSLLLTHVSANSRWRNRRFDVRSSVALDHEKDFLDRQANDETVNVSTLYLEGRDRSRDYAVRVGRQPANVAGVLGRYDGAWLEYRVSENRAASLAAGFPVELSNTDTVDTDKRFVSASYELTNLLQSLDLVPYFQIQQDTHVTERRAVGAEMRYFSPRGNYFGLADYDTLFSAMNILLINGNYVLAPERSVHFSFDRRKSPLLFLSNALIDNPVAGSMAQATSAFSEDELIALTRNQSGVTTLFNVGWTEQMGSTIQLSFDISHAVHDYSTSLQDADPALADDESTTGFATHLRFQDLILPGDLSVFGLTYTDSDRYSNTGFSGQNRLRLPAGWSIDSRIHADWREDIHGSRYTRLRPSVRAIFDKKRNYNIEAEAGWEVTDYGGTSSNANTQRFYYNVGYRWMFR